MPEGLVWDSQNPILEDWSDWIDKHTAITLAHLVSFRNEMRLLTRDSTLSW